MSLVRVFSLLTLFFGIIFLYLKLKRPQTIWLGISFLSFLFNFMMIFVIIFIQQDIQLPLIILAILFTVFVFSMPFLMVGTFLVNGIKIIRNEGFKFTNSLTLIFGMGLVGYLVVWPSIVDITESHILNTIYQFISFIVVYLSFISIFYTTTNLLNLLHLKRTRVDYFITLGAGLRGDEVTPLLAGRINKALELQRTQDYGKIVFSGGQGPDEIVAEGEAMAQYALDQGTNSDIILKETESKNTHQNIKFSKKIIDTDWNSERKPSIAIVTNNYHVLRGLMQARSLGIHCIGYGSRSKFYFSLNAFLREFVAYLQMTYKVHTIIIGLAGIVLFGMFLIVEFLI